MHNPVAVIDYLCCDRLLCATQGGKSRSVQPSIVQATLRCNVEKKEGGVDVIKEDFIKDGW